MVLNIVAPSDLRYFRCALRALDALIDKGFAIKPIRISLVYNIEQLSKTTLNTAQERILKRHVKATKR